MSIQDTVTTKGALVAETVYGENAHQQPAGLYSTETDDPLAIPSFMVIEGSTPSYNNTCDMDRLLQTITHIAAGFDVNYGEVPCIAIGGKHGNACGAGVGNMGADAIRKMVTGDPRAIFGGFVMVNFAMNEATTADLLHHQSQGKRLLDGVIAPSFTAEAIDALKRKHGKCRLIVNSALRHLSLDTAQRTRYVRGGFLAQPNYTFVLDFNHPELKVYGDRNSAVERDLILAWGVGSTSNSNTISLVKDGKLEANATGQQDRVGCAELLTKRAGDAGNDTKGAVGYSDSFFPFPDGPEVLISAGVKAIFSTSGSVRDKEIQEVCINAGVTLYQLPDKIARGFFGH